MRFHSFRSHLITGNRSHHAMPSALSRDPERSPLLQRRSVSRSASAIGPSKEELGACEVFATTLRIRALIIVSIHISAELD
jgi:hypothetical protein